MSQGRHGSIVGRVEVEAVEVGLRDRQKCLVGGSVGSLDQYADGPATTLSLGDDQLARVGIAEGFELADS